MTPLIFVFTDLEGSTRLWEQFPDAMHAALERHDAILRAAMEACHGSVVKTTGDGLMACFAAARDAIAACQAAQLGLRRETWSQTGPLLVRMGLHAGEAQPRAGDYYGPAVNRAARLMAAAHGGQVLLSAAAAGLLAGELPEGAALRDLGQHRLKDLERPEHVFQLVHPNLPAEFPPLATLDRRPNNLPAQPSSLIGRQKELEEVAGRLTGGGVRLLTLTGPGGIGKTRVALQAAAELIEHFEHGVYFVDLASIRHPEAVLPAIAEAVGVKEVGGRSLPDELKTFLRPRTLLLLLDNFEQVTAAAQAVVELLRDCPQLKLLVTSREALRVRGEYVFPIPPLGLPRHDLRPTSAEQLAGYEAVRLFVERAQAARADFKLLDEHAAAVAGICRRLDGLPLAIELAAARTRLFSPPALLERLGSRLNLLRGGARDLPERQQTLRGAIAWSYELLGTDEQHLFEMMSVFAGGCSFEAAEAVAAQAADLDVLDGLASLVEKSLLRQTEPEAGEPRLVMLETIREYAAERLAQAPERDAPARRAHAAYFAGLAQRRLPGLSGDDREAATAALLLDLENARAAWSYWVAAGDLDQLGKLTDSLWLLYESRGWYPFTVSLTRDLLGLLAAAPPTPERIQQEITLQTSLGRALMATTGYTPEVETAYVRAQELLQATGEAPRLLTVLHSLATLYTYLGQFEKLPAVAQDFLALAERGGEASTYVDAHLVMGYAEAFTNSPAAGLAQVEKALSYFSPAQQRSGRFRIGNHPGVVSHTFSAILLWLLGYPDRALQRAREGVQLAEKLNHPYSTAYAVFHNGLLHLWRGEADAAARCGQAVLQAVEVSGFEIWRAVANCLCGMGLARMGRIDDGLAQFRQGLDQYQNLKSPPVFWPLLLGMHAQLCAMAGNPAQGLALVDEALAIAGSWSGALLAPDIICLKGEMLLAAGLHNAAEAEAWLQRSLEMARGMEEHTFELRAALGLHRLRRAQGIAYGARELVSSVYAQFTEGFTTSDLVEARGVMESGAGAA